MQETGAVGVDADMTAIRHAGRQHVAALGEGIARPGQRCAAEGQGQACLVRNHLDHIGIEQRGDVLDRFSQGGDTGLRIGCQVGCHLIDDHRRNQRFVALHVDHDGIGRQTELAGHFSQAIGAGVVILTSQQHLGAKGLAGLDDARVVGGDHHTAGRALPGLLPDVLHHGLAGDVLQRLAGQAGGGVTGGNHDGEGCAHLLVQTLVGIEGACFAFQHHRDAVANRVGHAGALADQLGLVFGKLQRALADRAGENIEQFKIHGGILSGAIRTPV